MDWIDIVLYCVLGIVVLFIAVIFIRAATFRPKKTETPLPVEVNCNREKTVADLRAMITCKTVSDTDPEKEDDAEFDKFENLLKERFPLVSKTCEFTKLGKRSLLYRWKGKDDKEQRVMMAHYDVVSIEQHLWSKPAFEGILENDVIWGRGSLDTKVTLNGIMQSVEQLIGEGFVPQHDIYLAFSGNEETNGDGAPTAVNYFKNKGIRPKLVCDEGGAVCENVFPGVKQACALVGTAEKGIMNVRFSYDGKGGHASTPPRHTPVGKLSSACAAVEAKPFPRRPAKPARELFDTVGRYSTFAYRMIFANLWLFGGLLDAICKKQGGELNALMRTTAAFTQMSGSKGMNVIPPHAEMTANLRLMHGDTAESAAERLRKVIGDDEIKIDILNSTNPSAISITRDEEWARFSAAISATWKDVIVSPYLMLACSDSRHYCEISDHVYRFSAMALTKAERGMIHGNDERIPVETAVKTVEFYLRLIRAL